MSDGSGKYKINKANNVQRGTTIVLHLKDTESQYCSNSNVMKLIKKYSNFLNYPIKLDGQLVNTIKALWTMDPKTITENQYSEFYKFIANTWDSPMLKFHYKADIPLQIKSLFFVGSTVNIIDYNLANRKIGNGENGTWNIFIFPKSINSSKMPKIIARVDEICVWCCGL